MADSGMPRELYERHKVPKNRDVTVEKRGLGALEALALTTLTRS